jgi:hypothetical protein
MEMIDTRNFPPPSGGPAFPTPRIELNHKGVVTGFAVMADGMTLRDYFAAKAMQAIFTGAVIEAITMDQDIDCDKAAKTAYTMAAAMLEARK